MYSLTLTSDERKAIDWVGHRYENGDQLRNLLDECQMVDPYPFDEDQDLPEWDTAGPVTFSVPEPIAWRILEIAEYVHWDWPCFSRQLAAKLTEFCTRIV